MRDMEDRMGREASNYQDSIARLEADIAKMKVIIFYMSVKLQWELYLCLGFYGYYECIFFI